MKTNIYKLFFLFLISFGLFYTANAQNLVVNGGFETWTEASAAPDNWEYTSTSGVTFSQITGTAATGEVTEGTKAFSMVSTGNPNRGIIQHVQGIEGGEKYTISFWYKETKAPNNSTGGIFFAGMWVDAAMNDLPYVGEDAALMDNQTALSSSDNLWLPFAIEEVTAPAGATQLYLDISITRQSGFVIDDVRVEKVAAPFLTVSETSLSVIAAGEAKTVDVTSNVEWTAASDAAWLTVTPASGENDGQLTLTAAANSTTAERTATVTVSTEAEGVAAKTVIVTQPGTTTGISVAKTNTVSVYPNPVTEAFRLQGVEGAALVTVTDLNGRSLLAQTISGEEAVSVASLEQGVYIVRIQTAAEGVKVGRIVKK